MGPVIGNGIRRPLLCDWGVWARLHRAPPFSPRPASLFQMQIVMAQELMKPLVLHLRAGKGHPMSGVMWGRHWQCWNRIPAVNKTNPSTLLHWWLGQLQQLDWGVPKHRVRCYCENDTDAGICTSSSSDGPWSSGVGDRFSHAIPGQWTSLWSQRHATNVAKYRNLPAWVVLRVAALSAKAFYGV